MTPPGHMPHPTASSATWQPPGGSTRARTTRTAPARVWPTLAVPVRILRGELDPWPNARGADELAALFPDATVTVLPGAGHFPWVDDATSYAAAVARAVRD